MKHIITTIILLISFNISLFSKQTIVKDTVKIQPIKSPFSEALFLSDLIKSVDTTDFYYLSEVMNDSLVLLLDIGRQMNYKKFSKPDMVYALNYIFNGYTYKSYDISKYNDKTENGESVYLLHFTPFSIEEYGEINVSFYLKDGKITCILLQ